MLDLFKESGRFLKSNFVSLLPFLFIGPGLTFFILPGLYLYFIYYFIFNLAILYPHLDRRQSFALSKKMVKKRKGVIGTFCLFDFINMIAMIKIAYSLESLVGKALAYGLISVFFIQMMIVMTILTLRDAPPLLPESSHSPKAS